MSLKLVIQSPSSWLPFHQSVVGWLYCFCLLVPTQLVCTSQPTQERCALGQLPVATLSEVVPHPLWLTFMRQLCPRPSTLTAISLPSPPFWAVPLSRMRSQFFKERTRRLSLPPSTSRAHQMLVAAWEQVGLQVTHCWGLCCH